MRQPSDASVREIQIIYGAILLGALAFGIVVLVLRTQGLIDFGEASADLRILAWIAAGSLAAFAPLAFVLRGIVLQRAEGRGARAAQRAGWILFAALLEGCCLFNLVVWLLVGEALLNGVAAAIAWAIMAAGFPTAAQLGEHS